MLRTPRLELTLQTPQEVLAWVESLPPEVRSEISPTWLDRLKKAVGPDPWSCMFRIRMIDSGFEIGSCGFKGSPDDNGVVEIACGIDECYRNEGFATESAGALKEYAISLGEVKTVRARTANETSPQSDVRTMLNRMPR